MIQGDTISTPLSEPFPLYFISSVSLYVTDLNIVADDRAPLMSSVLLQYLTIPFCFLGVNKPSTRVLTEYTLNVLNEWHQAAQTASDLLGYRDDAGTTVM
jgi:hypothetical protein